MKLIIITITYHTPQNRASDIIMHVTLNIINGLVLEIFSKKYQTSSHHHVRHRLVPRWDMDHIVHLIKHDKFSSYRIKFDQSKRYVYIES